MHEPPGYQLHTWREDSGLITHTAVFGEWPDPIRYARRHSRASQ